MTEFMEDGKYKFRNSIFFSDVGKHKKKTTNSQDPIASPGDCAMGFKLMQKWTNSIAVTMASDFMHLWYLWTTHQPQRVVQRGLHWHWSKVCVCVCVGMRVCVSVCVRGC